MRAVVLALALVAAPAAAEVASVFGGEHPEFTRIVIEAQEMGDWRFGRTDDGYELQPGSGITGFDLSRAFDRIPKDRVSGLFRDPESGRLRLSLSCPCHAIAFEFRPGTVVIDIKTGAPPDGSSFEMALDTGAAPEPLPVEDAPAAPPAPGYDWVGLVRGTEAPTATRDAPAAEAAAASDPVAAPVPAAPADPSLEPLRDALLSQISQGVAEGVIDLAETDLSASPATGPTEREGARIAVGELPGISVGTVRTPEQALTAEGAACLTDEALSVGTWAGEGPVAEQIGPARNGLVTEFDAPDDAAILRAARLYLALGFGAEARQALGFRTMPAAGEGALLLALSHVVDLEPGDPGPLADQAACDTAAALWHLLAHLAAGHEGEVPGLNTDAVERSFGALPAHLRRHFGPALVAWFLARGEEETARLLRDATLRAPGEAGPEVALMDAGFMLSQGDATAAATLAEGVRAEAGPRDLAATLTLVAASLAGGPALPPDVPAALEAALGVTGTPGEEARVLAALAAAHALTGAPEAALALLPRSPESFDTIWALTAATMPPDLFLTAAIPPAAEGRRSADPATNVAVATRLAEAGFPAQALAWLGPDAPPEALLLAARAHLALRDAPAALAALARAEGPEVATLQAEARLQLGDTAAAVAAYDLAGDPEGRDQARRRGADWPGLARDGSAPWSAAAALVAVPAPAAEGGPLARGLALADESAAARAAVEALLLVQPDPG